MRDDTEQGKEMHLFIPNPRPTKSYQLQYHNTMPSLDQDGKQGENPILLYKCQATPRTAHTQNIISKRKS